MAARKPAKAVNEAVAAAEKQPDGSTIYLDPRLAEIRDAEMAKLAAIEIAPRQDATIDPVLVKLREAEIKRGPRVL
jgi:hypothetical protein